jgi:signal transduction histidine kinase
MNARTLLRQVNDLLDLSKLDAGKLAAHYQRVDLPKLLEYTMDHFSSLSANKGIRLETTTQEAMRELEVDPEKVYRCLQILG